MSAPGAGCSVAEWDSAFFGLRIGRLEPETPSAPEVDQAVQWAERHRLDCLYALADAAHRPSIRAMEQRGFEFADVRLTLDREVEPNGPAPECHVEVARPEDLDLLSALARASHGQTRFTEDPRFGVARASEMYAVWLAQAFAEDDAHVLVPRVDGRAGGYLTLHGVSRPEASIGLIAVAPDLRGRGIGRGLIQEGLRRLARDGAGRLRVVTQGRSAAAVRFYEECGFRARRCQFWYHRWFGR